MVPAGDETSEIFQVVVNHDGQYSLWKTATPIPDGWRPEGFEGSRDACVAHIDEVWIDMRPNQLRQQMPK